MGSKFNSNPWKREMRANGDLLVTIPDWLYLDDSRDFRNRLTQVPQMQMAFTGTAVPTGHLIAATPKLYQCLKEAIVWRCLECRNYRDGVDYLDYRCGRTVDTCEVKKWVVAIREAEGEK
ncbi:MAG: hypothetical protein AB7F40_10255 [Victivallaceae bacterium]